MTSRSRHRFPVLVHLLAFRGEELLLIRRAGTGIADGFWVPPGGHLEAGETPRAAVVREALEEVGVSVPAAAVQAAAVLFYPSAGGGLNLLFRAELDRPVVPLFDPAVADGAAFWPRSALPSPLAPWLPEALERCDGGAWYGESSPF